MSRRSPEARYSVHAIPLGVTRSATENCSQFVLNIAFVNEAYLGVVSGPYDYVPLENRRGDDIIFYADRLGQISHVAYVGADGRIISKFHNDPQIYVHEPWGEPISKLPFDFSRTQVYRRVSRR